MANTYQGTYFINDVASSYGFSENYYYEAADIDAAVSRLQVNILLRLDVLTELHQMVGARVSDVRIRNDSKLVGGLPALGTLTATVQDQVQPWSALLTRNEASSLYRGRFYLHGVLESTFSDNRVYDPANPNATAWGLFFADLLAGFQLRHFPETIETYTDFSAIIPMREVERKVGRPFGLLRGRRRIAP